MNRFFYYQNNYVRLQDGSLVPMTARDVEQFFLVNRSTHLTAFVHPEEARNLPKFWTQTDLSIKQVRLDETFRSSILTMMNRELPGVYDLVKDWLLSLDQSLISFTAQIPIV